MDGPAVSCRAAGPLGDDRPFVPQTPSPAFAGSDETCGLGLSCPTWWMYPRLRIARANPVHEAEEDLALAAPLLVELYRHDRGHGLAGARDNVVITAMHLIEHLAKAIADVGDGEGLWHWWLS